MTNDFQTALIDAKKQLGLTQSQMAVRLSVSKRTVELWLAGERVPMAITQEGALARLGAGGSSESAGLPDFVGRPARPDPHGPADLPGLAGPPSQPKAIPTDGRHPPLRGERNTKPKRKKKAKSGKH